jgi:hypothetical protein
MRANPSKTPVIKLRRRFTLTPRFNEERAGPAMPADSSMRANMVRARYGSKQELRHPSRR